MIAAAKNAKVPVCVHLDHGTSMEMVYRALRLGFTSVMIDASALPYEKNLALTKQVTEMAHAMDVSVEAELGRLVTGEAGSAEPTEKLKAEDYYTDPVEAKEFCAQTGVDALAIAFGTAHGFYTAQPKLDFDVVKNVAKATGLPLVMHGGSGVSDEGFAKAIENGIRKINYYSYMSKAGYMAAKERIEKGDTNYLHDVEYAAMFAMKEDVKRAIQLFSK
jgi:fructose-bisphosphate aldolase class II